jgi:hypothetical protein
MRRFGNYDFTILSLGRTNASGVFMSLKNVVFHEYLDKFVRVLIDDTFIYSWMTEELDKHLRLVLQFLQETVEILLRNHCLGHAISDEGITMDPVKVEAIMECNAPKNVPGVCGFWV